MRPQEHCNPDHTTSHAVNKSNIRILYAIEAALKHPFRHPDTKSAFTTELYLHDKFPLYVRKIPRFYTTLTHADRTIGELHLNLYGTKPA